MKRCRRKGVVSLCAFFWVHYPSGPIHTEFSEPHSSRFPGDFIIVEWLYVAQAAR